MKRKIKKIKTKKIQLPKNLGVSRSYQSIAHSTSTSYQAQAQKLHKIDSQIEGPQQQLTDICNEKETKLVTFYGLNSTHITFTQEKLNTVHIFNYCNSRKCRTKRQNLYL